MINHLECLWSFFLNPIYLWRVHSTVIYFLRCIETLTEEIRHSFLSNMVLQSCRITFSYYVEQFLCILFGVYYYDAVANEAQKIVNNTSQDKEKRPWLQAKSSSMYCNMLTTSNNQWNTFLRRREWSCMISFA